MSSTTMLVRSFAKINLAMTILDKRSDGYHEIRTVLQSIDLCDELEFRHCPELKLQCEGLELPVQSNLVWKAAHLLAREGSIRAGAEILLRKRIPAGAGLGGASGNAAATLLALNRLWSLGASPEDLAGIAARLGSDVPFFLHGGTALAAGRGEETHPLPDLPPVPVLVVFPGFSISTEQAYRSASLKLTLPQDTNKIARFCSKLVRSTECLSEIFNDFETSVLPEYPEVKKVKKFLEHEGAVATLLSGSGSSVFGFFLDEESTLAASRSGLQDSWRAFPAKTLSRRDYLNQLFG